jgi:hypothetical protein
MTAETTQYDSRQYFRVQYPTALRPRLHVNGESLPVIDISERGLRLVNPRRSSDGAIEPQVAATLRFRDGVTTPIRGKIVRVTERDIALHLETGLSYQLIVREQRALMGQLRYALV